MALEKVGWDGGRDTMTEAAWWFDEVAWSPLEPWGEGGQWAHHHEGLEEAWKEEPAGGRRGSAVSGGSWPMEVGGEGASS